MSDKRISPENFLQRVKQEEKEAGRGKLKIYLGFSPGVGKTFTMLHDALAKRAKGLDVVIGVVESHGREKIDSLSTNLETIPRKEIPYRGKNLLEFDLDAALKRNPGLILVDELAHSNAPGLRHTKRWQDIKELIDRGIDVYTTLNVQHIESLNDDILRIVGQRVQETIPDSILEAADTIELIDLPPEDLLKRLQEGKIYYSAQAELAKDHFFRKGNLIALRELALRVTAACVETQVLLYRKGEGIKNIWPVRDKILVCIGPSAASIKIIRKAKRVATSLQTNWVAVYIDVPDSYDAEQKLILANQHLVFAEQLGAETKILTGRDIVKELMTFAREQNVTQIIIWKEIRPRWKEILFRNLANEIVRQSGDIDVYVMTGNAASEEQIKADKKTIPQANIPWRVYLITVGIVTLVTAINSMFYPFLEGSNLIMAYLLGVILVALLGHSGPAMVGSLLSVLAYNFFFIQPFHSFAAGDIKYTFTLLVMLLISQVIAQLTVINRRQVGFARLAERQTAALHTLSKQLANTRGLDKLLEIAVHCMGEIFQSEVLILLPINGRLEISARYKTKEELTDKKLSVAQWVYELGQMAGLGTDTLSFSDALYVPLKGLQEIIGVLSIRPAIGKKVFTAAQMQLLGSCVNQISFALEADRLYDQKIESNLLAETDKARDGLLQTFSSEMRGPLISAMDVAGSLMDMGNELENDAIVDKQTVKRLGDDLYLELDHFHRLVNNLLQTVYLEPEKIQLNKQFLLIQEVILDLIQKSAKKLNTREIKSFIMQDLPPIFFDKDMIEEVLLNLIDNAAKFTPLTTGIDISVTLGTAKSCIVVSIEDYGPGVASDEINMLFEKFYRGKQLTDERGLGLGLAICQKIIAAHGGEIWAENLQAAGKGAAFRFTLPL